MQGTVLQDGFHRQSLKCWTGNDAAVRNAEAIAEFEGGAANDDLLVPQFFQRSRIATQHLDIGHSRNRRGADTEINQERGAPLGVLARQYGGHRGYKPPFEFFAKGIASDQTIRFDRNVYDRRPRMIRKLFQRAIDMNRAGIAAGLLERRQNNRSAVIGKGIDKILVRRSFGWRAEIDVECDVAYAGVFQPPEQFGVQPSRPWPDPDFFNRRGIDGNNDDIAAGVARHPSEAQVGQSVAESAMPAGQQNRRERQHDKNMWPILLQVLPLARLKLPKCAPLSLSIRISG